MSIIAPFSEDLMRYPFVVICPTTDSTKRRMGNIDSPWFAIDPRYDDALDALGDFLMDWDETGHHGELRPQRPCPVESA